MYYLILFLTISSVPNAGKSTFLDAVTNARPKIAPYAFTTIIPNLGVCEISGGKKNGGDSMIIADIPGLVEGAHKGIGLGRSFLRHIERCFMIVHIINGDSSDPVGDYLAINRELKLFSPVLASKPQVVVLNKIDLENVSRLSQDIQTKLSKVMSHKRLLTISASNKVGVDEVITRTYSFLQKLKLDEDRQKSNGINLSELDPERLIDINNIDHVM